MSAEDGGHRWRAAYTVSTPDCWVPHALAYDAPFGAALADVAEAGYDGVELQVRNAATLDADALEADIAAAGLAVAAIATGAVKSEDGLTLADADAGRRAEAVARVRAAVDLAGHLGVCVTIGGVRGGPSPDDPVAVGMVRDAIAAIARHAADRGVRVVLEPQNRFAGPLLLTVAETIAFIDDLAVADPDAARWVGVVADTFHMAIEERSAAGALVRAGDRLWHVQLGENNRRPLGEGDLPLGGILDVLDALAYDGWLTMEHGQTPTSARAARQSLAALRAVASG